MINAAAAGNAEKRRRSSRSLSMGIIRQDTRRGSRAGSIGNLLEVDGFYGASRRGSQAGNKGSILKKDGAVGSIRREISNKDYNDQDQRGDIKVT